MDFNIDEIFELAEQMERNGAKFYRAAAEAISDKEQQQQLVELALMEDEHERTFSGMRELLSSVEKRESTYEGDDAVVRNAPANQVERSAQTRQRPADRCRRGGTEGPDISRSSADIRQTRLQGGHGPGDR